MSPLLSKGYIESPTMYIAPSHLGRLGMCMKLTGLLAALSAKSGTSPAVPSME